MIILSAKSKEALSRAMDDIGVFGQGVVLIDASAEMRHVHLSDVLKVGTPSPADVFFEMPDSFVGRVAEAPVTAFVCESKNPHLDYLRGHIERRRRK